MIFPRHFSTNSKVFLFILRIGSVRPIPVAAACSRVSLSSFSPHWLLPKGVCTGGLGDRRQHVERTPSLFEDCRRSGVGS